MDKSRLAIYRRQTMRRWMDTRRSLPYSNNRQEGKGWKRVDGRT
jgi:hypothetical protein